MQLRGFQCYYYKLDDKYILRQNSNTSCWAGLKNAPSTYTYYEGEGNNIKSITPIFTDNYIYIDKYKQDRVSEKSVKRIVELINKITDCSIVKINEIDYIKYDCLPNHYQNLTLLNIIRMLWYAPHNFNNRTFLQKSIFEDDSTEDPLSFLLRIIDLNIDKTQTYIGYGDHSCIYKNIIITRTKEDLLNYKGTSMQYFLTNSN